MRKEAESLIKLLEKEREKESIRIEGLKFIAKYKKTCDTEVDNSLLNTALDQLLAEEMLIKLRCREILSKLINDNIDRYMITDRILSSKEMSEGIIFLIPKKFFGGDLSKVAKILYLSGENAGEVLDASSMPIEILEDLF